jgi:hypothetical protein
MYYNPGARKSIANHDFLAQARWNKLTSTKTDDGMVHDHVRK